MADITDITGIAKIVDSKVVERAYEDAGSEPAKEIGKLGVDIVRTFRLFTAPFQLLATAQVRFENYLNDVRNAVPRDRQIQADPQIAGPVLMNLRFIDEENDLRHLYLNLLKLAIDSEHCEEAHPGFIKVIEHFSPKDALFLQKLAEVCPLSERANEHQDLPCATAVQFALKRFDWKLSNIQASLDLLQGLSVVQYEVHNVANLDGPFYKHVGVEITEFGRKFIESCMPERLS